MTADAAPQPPEAPQLAVEWLGRCSYSQGHDRMKAVLDARIAGVMPDTLLLSEPEPVFTLGRRREAASHVLDPGDVPILQVERGGDVTFHGPGQLVGYPIVALAPGARDLHAWLRTLEQVIIDSLAELGVVAGRDARNSGVWIDGRKVCAVGIACRRWVTWHGFALNVDVDLAWFRRIDPCGMDSALVTRLADHLDPSPSLDAVRAVVARHFRNAWATLPT